MKRLVLAALLATATDLCGIALIGTAAWLIARAAQQPPMAALSVAIVGVRGFAIAKGGLRYLERLAGHDAALDILARLRTAVYARLSEAPDLLRRPLPSGQPAGRATGRGAGRRGRAGGVPPDGGLDRQGDRAAADAADGAGRADLLSRLVSDVDSVQDLLLRCAIPAAVAGLVALAAVGFTAAIAPLPALVLAAGLAVAGGVLPAVGYLAARRRGRRLAAARAAHVVASVDVLAGAADLAAFGATGAALGRAEEAAARVASLERSAGRTSAVIGAAGGVLPALTAVTVCVLAARTEASVLVAVLCLVALAAVEAVLPVSAAAVRYADLRASWARVKALLNPDEDGGLSTAAIRARIAVDRSPSHEVPGVEPARDPVRIRLAGVGVTYPGAVAAALDGVDLDLPPGRRVAVVGPSGAGKSTLLGLLAGTVAATAGRCAVTVPASGDARPPEGRIAPGGGDTAPLGWPWVGGVFSDGYVFDATIRENLTLGRPGYDAPDLFRALSAAGLSELADRLDEPAGGDGGRLSGGQRQRLLLARLLLAPPPVLLLDEPTEGLEPAAADALLASVLRITSGHTVVLVTHRLADLSAFDEVVVLDAGRVAQRGSHRDLLGVPGWYATWANGSLVPTG